MSAATVAVQQATIRQYAKRLQLATVGGQFTQVAEQALKEKKSLVEKGGTLDQLEAAARDIPNGKIPFFNTLADATKAAAGDGPLAKYAAIALGVSDDYSKITGGGGSDTSREQALHLLPTNASPAARKGSLEGIRGTVNSQIRESARIKF
jgi:hypothetical protein